LQKVKLFFDAVFRALFSNEKDGGRTCDEQSDCRDTPGFPGFPGYDKAWRRFLIKCETGNRNRNSNQNGNARAPTALNPEGYIFFLFRLSKQV
jgi:hypothetical protein